MAKSGADPSIMFTELTRTLSKTWYAPIGQPSDAPLRAAVEDHARQRARECSSRRCHTGKIVAAPGNGAAIGVIKLSTSNGRIAARPSGTEDIYKIHAESFVGNAHLAQLQADAGTILGSL